MQSTEKIIFTIARMNPPTPGHMLLIERLITEAISNKVDNVYIILSSSNANSDNPLDCDYKKTILSDVNSIVENYKKIMMDKNPTKNKEIQHINVTIICSKNPFMEPFNIIGNHNYTVNSITLIQKY
jgi:hypothetical protein